MHPLGSYAFNNVYSAFSPLLNTASAVCYSDKIAVPCSNILADIGFFFLGALSTAMIIGLILLIVIPMWKVFTKAGKPGWAVFIPFYNFYVMLKIVNKPTWWLVLIFVPFANVIIKCIVVYYLAKSFGKDIGFTLGLIFLPFIFLPILGFGKAQYNPQA